MFSWTQKLSALQILPEKINTQYFGRTLRARNRMAASGNPYPFGNDMYALARLSYLHSLIKQRIGFLLHPEIPIGDGSGLRVADIGAGTCNWLTELSDQLPSSAQLDAFDISASQYPPRHWLPENLSLRVHDAFLPFPKDAIGKYDIVHVQSFISLIRNNDPAPLIDNLTSLLKPEGYLQWNEIDAASGRMVKPADVPTSTDATNRFINFMQKPQAGHSINWVSQLDSTLAQQGFSNIKLTRYEIAPKDYFYWNLNRLWAADELGKNVNLEGAKEDEFMSMLAETFGEFQQGVAVTADLIVAIGKRSIL